MKKADQPDRLSSEHLICRVDRHAWDRSLGFSDIMWDNKARTHATLTRVKTCEACGTVKTITYAYPSMEILSSRMKYPDGYLVSAGRRFHPIDYRRALLAPMVESKRRRRRG